MAIETLKDYLENISEERKPIINKLRKVIKNAMPSGFEECLSYKMMVMLCLLKHILMDTTATLNYHYHL